MSEDQPAGENGSGPRSRGELGVTGEVGDTEDRGAVSRGGHRSYMSFQTQRFIFIPYLSHLGSNYIWFYILAFIIFT